MKLNFTRAFIALAVVTLIYTGCQKSGTKPTTSTTTSSSSTANEDALAVSMATNFYKGITGANGGSNINNGMEAASIASKKTTNKFQLDAVSSLCGYVVDTTYSSTSDVNDTSKYMSTRFKFVYRCLGGGKVNSYSCYDSVFVQDYNKKFLNTVDDIQDYNVVASDTTFTKYLLDGFITSNNSGLLYATTPSTTSGSKPSPSIYSAIKCYYKLIAVAVQVNKGGVPVIAAGYCTYVTSTHVIDAATGPSGLIMNYTGNIVFLGNNLAKLTIDPNHIYTINLVTGTIVARG